MSWRGLNQTGAALFNRCNDPVRRGAQLPCQG